MGAEDVPESGAPGESWRLRLGAAAGWGSALTGLGGVAIAVASAPWFSWTGNALSDLGHPARDSAALFNTSLVLSGALDLLFVWVLLPRLPRTRMSLAAAASLLLGAASLLGVGAVNESYGSPHLWVSITYFAFASVGITLAGLALRTRSRRFGWTTFVAGVVSVAFSLMVSSAILYGAPFPSQAVPELIASVLFSAWTVATGWAMWTHSSVLGGPAKPAGP